MYCNLKGHFIKLILENNYDGMPDSIEVGSTIFFFFGKWNIATLSYHILVDVG